MRAQLDSSLVRCVHSWDIELNTRRNSTSQCAHVLFSTYIMRNVINHIHYNFLKFDWCINCFLFSNYCVGLKSDSKIGQLHQPTILGALSSIHQSTNHIFYHNSHSNNHLPYKYIYRQNMKACTNNELSA